VFLSAFFFLLSLDEAAGIHAMLNPPLGRRFNATGIFYFVWVVPGAVMVLCMGLAYWRFLCHLPTNSARRLRLAAGLFVAGALGVEMVGGWLSYHHGEENLLYNLAATVEESLEMAGAALFIHGLLTYLRERHPSIWIRLD
jgi:hypothetical protein